MAHTTAPGERRQGQPVRQLPRPARLRRCCTGCRPWPSARSPASPRPPGRWPANSQYVVLGGEFPPVNGTGQQGLARFAVRAIAPNAQGPQGVQRPDADPDPARGGHAPGRTGTRPGTGTTAGSPTSVLRGATLGSSVVVGSFTADTTWWTRPDLALTDTAPHPAAPRPTGSGSRDPLGNQMVSATTAGTVPAGAPAAERLHRPRCAPTARIDYWRLGEAAGTHRLRLGRRRDLTLAASAQRGTAGALVGDADTATTFTGTAGVPASTTRSRRGAAGVHRRGVVQDHAAPPAARSSGSATPPPPPAPATTGTST